MGSEQFSKVRGIERCGEDGQGLPGAFTVIGHDITAKALIALYVGTRRAQYAADVITGIVQTQRTKKLPDAGFIDTLRGGVTTPIIVTDLGADKDGKKWAVVVEGRQRKMGVDFINKEPANAGTPLYLRCIFRPFKADTAAIDSCMTKVIANARVARTPTQRAEDAADLKARNIKILPAMVDARDDDEVGLLVLLNDCADAVKDAVDAGTVGLAAVADLSKHTHEEQTRRIVRRAAPSRKQADAAAPPRPKARNARLGVAMARECARLEGIDEETLALARWFAGDDTALNDYPLLSKALDSAKGIAKA